MPSSRQILHDLVKNNLRLDKAHSNIGADGTIKTPKNIVVIPTQLTLEPIKKFENLICKEILPQEEIILDVKQEEQTVILEEPIQKDFDIEQVVQEDKQIETQEIQTVETDIKPAHRKEKKFGKEKKIKE